MNILLQSRLSTAYQQKMQEAIKVYPATPKLSKIVLGDWNDPNKISAIEGFKYLLNFFEFMAIGIHAGDLDEKMLRESLKSILITLTYVAEEYIKFVRIDSTFTYERLLWLKKRWTK